MLRVVHLKNLSYSESWISTPRLNPDIKEEEFLKAKIDLSCHDVEEFIAFCIDCRKFIREARKRTRINVIDGHSISYVEKLLYVAENRLFELYEDKMACYTGYPTPYCQVDSMGYTISVFGNIIVHKKYKWAPVHKVAYQKRIDKIWAECYKLLEDLKDGYY